MTVLECCTLLCSFHFLGDVEYPPRTSKVPPPREDAGVWTLQIITKFKSSLVRLYLRKQFPEPRVNEVVRCIDCGGTTQLKANLACYLQSALLPGKNQRSCVIHAALLALTKGKIRLAVQKHSEFINSLATFCLNYYHSQFQIFFVPL